jgi:hypothetical protein
MTSVLASDCCVENTVVGEGQESREEEGGKRGQEAGKREGARVTAVTWERAEGPRDPGSKVQVGATCEERHHQG